MTKRRGMGDAMEDVIGGKNEKTSTAGETKRPPKAKDKDKTSRKLVMGIVPILGVDGYYLEGAAKRLNVSERTLRTYITRGHLRAQRVGRRLFIAEENLRAFLRGERPSD
jgi:excisionase family DNA binding protein